MAVSYSKGSYELSALLHPGLLPHAFALTPRRGTISMGFYGHGPLARLRSRLAHCYSVDGGHPILIIVLEAMEHRYSEGDLRRCSEK